MVTKRYLAGVSLRTCFRYWAGVTAEAFAVIVVGTFLIIAVLVALG